VLPPDTNGDIGPNHYVQWVNLHYQIWNRAGVSLLGPSGGNTLWSGFGGLCQSTNQGDPVVRYDRMADRWVFSQFAFNVNHRGSPVAPYFQCFAVSTTGDPTGTYNRYSFQIPSILVNGSTITPFNDYPKLAVWPDAYYMTFNYFDLAAPPANQFIGAGAWAFDRTKMVNGQPATAVSFTTPSAYGGLLASDLDGPILPPAGSPNYFAAIDAPVDAANAPLPGLTLQIWKFHVNWTTPGSSTFGTPTHSPDYNLAVPSYRWGLCNGSQNCVSQPGTSVGLDPIGDRLMNRLQYRHFADGHESLVANHTVGIGTTGDQAAIRWYEVRTLSTTPTLYQQGTYSPSTDNRWMGSIAMDKLGDIAVGYSVSSSTVSASIRYAGRIAGDTLATLPQAESIMVAGSGSQTSGSFRWGDYSMLAVDPTDDCTFWYTQEYYVTTSDHGWRTRIGSFRFPACSSVSSVVSTRQYTLSGSDGTTWTDLDAVNLSLTITPTANSTAILSGNADLFTANAGYNQDLGIDVNGTIAAWKEGGGFAGTFSPNAAMVQTVVSMSAGSTYTVKLRWKTNKPAAGVTIYAGAGSGQPYSPTRLTAQLLPAGTNPASAVSSQQYTLSGSDGTTWRDLDAANLSLTITPPSNSTAILSGNADLFTADAGYNQDLAIDVNGTIAAWKESGGFAGTFSPNAAFVQTVVSLNAGTTYTLKLRWKTNRSASGATIYAGAGPIGSQYSPTRLTAQVLPAGANPYSASSTQQYFLASSDGATWMDIDPTNLRLTITPSADSVAIVSGNADLWTANAGYNQDLGIDVNGTIAAWKESGGFAGTYSPNAAMVQTVITLTAGTSYTFTLRWKTNKTASGATIYSGAGASIPFSPTSLVALLIAT
jgi:hypothetical protein